MTLQYVRPDADSVDGNWLNASGNNTDLFDSLNETSFSDADYIKSSTTNGDIVRFRLSDPNAALASPAVIRFRCKREGLDAIDLTVRLKEGTTVIAYWEYAFVTDSFITIEEHLTGAQISAITDATNLFVELESGISLHRGAAVDLNLQTADYYSAGATIAITDVLSISRASIGYAKNADGTLTQFGNDTLRIGVGTGLLAEDARTNVVSHSQDFTTSWNNAVFGSLDPAVATAPDGTTTASKWIEGSADGRQCLYNSGSYTFSSGTSYACTFFVKPGTRRYIALDIRDYTSGDHSAICVDGQTGSITDTNSQGTVGVSSSVEVFGNGWLRLSIIIAGNNASTWVIEVAPSNSATPSWSSGTPSYQGDGSSYIYIWGAQIEAGAFPSSYIPTTTTSAARAADAITAIGVLQTILNASEASYYFSIAAIPNIPVTPSFLALDFDAGSHIGNDGQHNTVVIFDGTFNPIATLGGGLSWKANDNKCIGAWDAGGAIGNCYICADGGTVATGARGLTVNSNIGIANAFSGGSGINTYQKRLTVWNTRVPDATMQALTAP